MKRWLSLAAAAALCIALVGCGEQKTSPQPERPTTEQTTEQTTLPPKELSGSLPELIEGIYERCPLALFLETNELDLSDAALVERFTGVQDASRLAGAAVSEPMMGSQAYSLVLVRVKDASDAEAVAKEMAANIDPAKWVCVWADWVHVATFGDVVLLVMLSDTLEISTDAFVAAFGDECGGDFDYEAKSKAERKGSGQFPLF